MGVGGQCHALAALPPGHRPGTDCKGQNYGFVCDRGWGTGRIGGAYQYISLMEFCN